MSWDSNGKRTPPGAARNTDPASRRDFVVQLSATMLGQATVTIKMFVIPVLAPSIARDIDVPTASLGLYFLPDRCAAALLSGFGPIELSKR